MYSLQAGCSGLRRFCFFVFFEKALFPKRSKNGCNGFPTKFHAGGCRRKFKSSHFEPVYAKSVFFFIKSSQAKPSQPSQTNQAKPNQPSQAKPTKPSQAKPTNHANCIPATLGWLQCVF